MTIMQRLEDLMQAGLTINQSRIGSETAGLFKSDWISKICGKKPCVVVHVVENNSSNEL